jgi:hypothetical protein
MPIDVLALGLELKPALCARAERRLHFAAWVGCFGLLFLTSKLCNRG